MEKVTIEKAAAETKNSASAAKPVPRTAEPVYTVVQLADGYKAFGTTRAIVECALKLSGRESFTMNEAKKLVAEFKNRK